MRSPRSPSSSEPQPSRTETKCSTRLSWRRSGGQHAKACFTLLKRASEEIVFAHIQDLSHRVPAYNATGHKLLIVHVRNGLHHKLLASHSRYGFAIQEAFVVGIKVVRIFASWVIVKRVVLNTGSRCPLGADHLG